MAVGIATKKMLRAYIKTAPVLMFLSGFFQTPAENFYNSESVTIDIQRGDRDVAPVIRDMSAGYNLSSHDLYTNKEFIPPIYKEGFPINAFDTIKRQVGQDPFQSPDFRGNAIRKSMMEWRRIIGRIRRAVELQASQVLQSGVVTLYDAEGVEAYTIDYKPKATHFPTVTVSWGDANDDPQTDLVNLCEAIHNDSFQTPDVSIFSQTSFLAAMNSDNFRALFETRRIEQGTISGFDARGNGGIYRGYLTVGNYKLDVWTYNGKYKDQAGDTVPFVQDDKVIVLASGARLDATFGAIPRIVPPDSRVLPYMPARLRSGSAGLDLHPNEWVDQQGENVFGGLATRPLLIPTDIDSYGCLDTTA
jgi:hypothetical protein